MPCFISLSNALAQKLAWFVVHNWKSQDRFILATSAVHNYYVIRQLLDYALKGSGHIDSSTTK